MLCTAHHICHTGSGCNRGGHDEYIPVSDNTEPAQDMGIRLFRIDAARFRLVDVQAGPALPDGQGTGPGLQRGLQVEQTDLLELGNHMGDWLYRRLPAAAPENLAGYLKRILLSLPHLQPVRGAAGSYRDIRFQNHHGHGTWVASMSPLTHSRIHDDPPCHHYHGCDPARHVLSIYWYRFLSIFCIQWNSYH